MTREGVRAAWAAAAELLRARISRADLEAFGQVDRGCLGARLAVRALEAMRGDRGWALSMAASHAAGLPGRDQGVAWPAS